MMSSLQSLKQSLEEIKSFRKQYEVGEISFSHERGNQLERKLEEEKTCNLILHAKIHDLELQLAADRSEHAVTRSKYKQLDTAYQEHAQTALETKRKHKKLILQMGDKLRAQSRVLAEQAVRLETTSQLESELELAQKQISALLTKVHHLERVALPTAVQAQQQLQLEVKSLKLSLEEAIDCENALRDLLVQEQTSRRRRREQQ